ncbi:NAD(P)/FAD-dependent oxidoreductase [Amycolatopsis balhimycina]|uniref:NAD(P)/FAD-dependent oxidoreductase n=1 Tax=Amycolatopsis balhimycina TaxID=208443 RepID=UPI00037186AF|nr:FAD-dependent oxidoreductase [Amycolatopsis balhimycina]
MPAATRVVIVGAAAAGLAVAEAARSAGYGGQLVMVGEEEHRPYDRPPLSKQVLLGEWSAERIALRGDADLGKLGLDLRLGVPASGLDTDARELALADDSRIAFDALVVSTGVRARRLPGAPDARNVHVLRGLDDAVALREQLTPGARLVVIGAGVLGAEVAAVATRLRATVTLVDPLPVPMTRVVGAEVGEFVADLHREHGVDVRCGVGVRQLRKTGAQVDAVELEDGTLVPADVVLVAIGAVPAVDWLRGSAVPLGGRRPGEGAGGVLCAAGGRAIEGVYAAGDVAAWRTPDGDGHLRVEHRLNATEQGRAVAKSIVDPAFRHVPAVPYFWSDQYDVKIQSFGLPAPEDEFVVVDGSLAERRFVGAYLRAGVVTGALGVGMPRQLRAWRTRVGEPVPRTI